MSWIYVHVWIECELDIIIICHSDIFIISSNIQTYMHYEILLCNCVIYISVPIMNGSCVKKKYNEWNLNIFSFFTGIIYKIAIV
jgi:hypothetical protein